MSSKIKKFLVCWSIFSEGNEWPNQMVVKASTKSKARNEIERAIVPDTSFRITKVEAI
jgi:hypothetical protein